MTTPFRLGYLVPEFPRQTHIFFWRECEQLRRRGVEPVFLSTRRPPPAACPHAFRDQAAAATHYVFPPPPTSLFDLLIRPVGVVRALRYWLSLGGSVKDRLKFLGLMVCAAHLAGYCRRQMVTHMHVHSCGQAAGSGRRVDRKTGSTPRRRSSSHSRQKKMCVCRGNSGTR